MNIVDNKTGRIEKLCAALKGLTEVQLELIRQIVDQFNEPYILIERLETSDIVNECLQSNLGDAIRIHHTFSKEPFTKDKFEYALERISNVCGAIAELAPKGNPGHDITINGIRISLKTQADSNIREDRLHISKFMELGKGEWSDSIEHLTGLREQFFYHMNSYDRIFSLRCLSKKSNDRWHYELVEIPKSLLEEAHNGTMTMRFDSPQNPKPGYCDVRGIDGELKFQLYFDGGTERKLQIRYLLKKYCIVHATWIFPKTAINLDDSETLLNI